MRKIFAVVALLAAFAACISSCDDSATYAQQLEDEKESIRAFIKDSSIVVVDTIPSVVPWPDKVFYKTESGLFVHVNTVGTFVDTIPTNTLITVRFYEIEMDGEEGYTNWKGTADPIELYYNNVSSSATYGDCLAWHEGLDYVGDGGEIEMIVPASLGWSMYTEDDELIARYYKLRYTFWK
jgi:hypothetical protein